MDADIEVCRVIPSDGVGSPQEAGEELSRQQSTVLRKAEAKVVQARGVDSSERTNSGFSAPEE